MSTPHFPVAEARSGRSGSAKRTLLLWLLSIAIFYALFRFFSPSRSGAGEAWPGLLLAAFAVAFFGWAVWWQRLRLRFAAELRQAQALVDKGQLADAAVRFTSLAQRHPWKRQRSLAELSLARVELSLGQLDAAIERLVVVERMARSANLFPPRIGATAILGLCYAMKNDVTAAQAWLDAYDKLPGPRSQAETLARAVLDCRRGKLGEVARDLETRWRELEARHTGNQLRQLRVVRAFAAANAGTRDAEQAPVLLQPLGPGAREELAWLGAGWPELADFIATHLS